jgi:hypothetical protein
VLNMPDLLNFSENGLKRASLYFSFKDWQNKKTHCAGYFRGFEGLNLSIVIVLNQV